MNDNYQKGLMDGWHGDEHLNDNDEKEEYFDEYYEDYL